MKIKRLFNVQFFTEVGVEEGGNHINLMGIKLLLCRHCEQGFDSLRLHHSGKSFEIVTPSRYPNPLATHRALYLLMLPSMFRFLLKAHLAVRTC